MKLVLGYCRVSTEGQCLDRQMDELERYGVDKIYPEKMTGTQANRPELEKLLESVRAGDTVVVESLSRLSRSTKDLLAMLEGFEGVGVKFISLKENIDTSTATGKMVITVLAAITQFERDIIVQRTREGLAAARARGRTGGRPRVPQKQINSAIKLYQSKSYSVGEVCKLAKISPATLYKYLRNMTSVEELNV